MIASGFDVNISLNVVNFNCRFSADISNVPIDLLSKMRFKIEFKKFVFFKQN